MVRDREKGEKEGVQLDPRGGDAILKRMLQTKPKTHEEMVKERHKAAPASKGKTKSK